jgi:hypothetical protein
MTTQNDTAQAMGEAAALPSATKTEARTARPATKQKENNMKTTDKRANTWTPKSAICGDDAARVLGLQVTAFVLYQLTAILDREEPDDWPSAATDSSLAVQIAMEEVLRIEQAIHAGREIDDIHHALIRLGCLLRCAWLAYTPQSSTYPGRVLESLPDSINAFCHLLEVAQSTPEWTGAEEGGQHAN